VTSVELFELALDGKQQPHRQFLIEDGAIVEVFEPISSLLHKYVAQDHKDDKNNPLRVRRSSLPSNRLPLATARAKRTTRSDGGGLVFERFG
jgi:hypothetical protein